MSKNTRNRIRVEIARYPTSVVFGHCGKQAYEEAGRRLPVNGDRYDECVAFDVETLYGRVILSYLEELPDKNTAEIAVKVALGTGKRGSGRRTSAYPNKIQRSFSIYEKDVEYLEAQFDSVSKGLEILIEFHRIHHKFGTEPLVATPNYMKAQREAAAAGRQRFVNPNAHPAIAELDAMPEPDGSSGALPAGSDALGLFDDI
jgi:hypothetical protein